MRSYVVVALLGLWTAPAQADDPKPLEVTIPERSTPPNFEEDIADFLLDRCAGCHGSALAENGLDLESFEALMKGGKSGPAVVPGKADESPLFLLAAHRKAPEMPPRDKAELMPLTAEELGLLRLWIDAGARNEPGSAPTRPKPAVTLGSLPAGVAPIAAIDLSGDGKRVAFGRGNRVQIADLESGPVLVTLGDHEDIVQSVRFSRDGKRLAAGSYQVVTVWDVPMDVTQWASPNAWTLRATLGPHADRVLAIDFSPDGKWLAAGGGEPSRTGEIKLWEVETGALRATLDAVHSDTVYGLRFSPDGKWLATAGADKFLKVLEMPDGKVAKTFEGHTHHVLGVDWKPDGKELASAGADAVVKIWDMESGEQKRTTAAAGKAVTSVRWLADKPLIVGSAGDGTVRLWKADDGQFARTLSGAGEYLNAATATANGSRVAAGGPSGSVHVWNGENGEVVRKLAPETGVSQP